MSRQKKQQLDLIEGIEFFSPPEEERAPIDEWQPTCPEDEVFKTVRGAIITDVSSVFQLPSNPQLDSFIMSSKRSYNNPDMRAHTIQYLNYFEKYYDRDHELVVIYARLKYLIDFEPGYTKEAFLYDLTRYIMNGSISLKVGYLTRDCYSLNLTYKNLKNPNLQYSDLIMLSHPNMET